MFHQLQLFFFLKIKITRCANISFFFKSQSRLFLTFPSFQGSLNFITAGYNTMHSENDPEKIPEQASGQIVEDNFPEDPVIRSQGSTILDSMQCDSTCSTGKSVLGKQDLNAFPLTSQTSKDHDFENPNDSGNGSNSIQSQHKKKSSEDKSGGSEAVQRGWRTKWSV